MVISIEICLALLFGKNLVYINHNSFKNPISSSQLLHYVLVCKIKQSYLNCLLIGVTVLPSNDNFKPFDYILHAALNGSLALSLNPWQSGITKSEEISKLLKLANKSCDQVFNDSISLWQLICKMRASLIRQSNRTIVRKVVRGLIYEDDCPLVITTEFQVEIRNIQTLSFSDIKAPPLYDFCKQLETLPRGIDFLKVFLENPIHYLHRRTRQ